MALVVRNIISYYFYFNDHCSDFRVKEWPMMRDPMPTILLLGGYLYFVLSLGPKLMENRKPFRLEGVMKFYNLFQVIFCSWIVTDGLRLCFLTNHSFICQPIDWSESETAMAIVFRIYCYYVIKMIDLLDTVFFVLRKKQNQVTFLHVYHHAGMVAVGWIGIKYLAGGHSIFMGLINCAVHVVMYFYYFLTSISEKYKKKIWWKKHITQLQMIQFGLIALHFIILGLQPDCNYPKFPIIFLVPQNLFMFCLFYDFYRKTYFQKKEEIKQC